MKSLPELLDRLGVRAKAHPAPLPADLRDNFGSGGTSWRVNLVGFDKRGGARVLQTPFWQGSAHRGPPTAADVVSSLVLDASHADSSFEDFCSDLGMYESSRSRQTYNAIQKMRPKLEAFFGDELPEVVEACAE
jgi:hypothetical protein